MARRRIVKWCRDGALHVDHIVVAKFVDFAGGDAGFNVRRDEVEHLRSEPTGDAHLLDVLLGFDHDVHDFDSSKKSKAQYSNWDAAKTNQVMSSAIA